MDAMEEFLRHGAVIRADTGYWIEAQDAFPTDFFEVVVWARLRRTGGSIDGTTTAYHNGTEWVSVDTRWEIERVMTWTTPNAYSSGRAGKLPR